MSTKQNINITLLKHCINENFKRILINFMQVIQKYDLKTIQYFLLEGEIIVLYFNNR